MKGFDYLKNGVVNHYADFKGRARREEFWNYVLFELLITLSLLFVLGIFLGLTGGDEGVGLIVLPLLQLIIGLGMFLPRLAVYVRRLHDTNRSGWWFLLMLVPFGVIVLIVFLASEGDKGPNQYGPDPKAEGHDVLSHLELDV